MERDKGREVGHCAIVEWEEERLDKKEGRDRKREGISKGGKGR